VTTPNNHSPSIKEKIRAYVLQNTSASGTSINDESLIFKEGYFDSMGLILMIAFIEDEFNIKTSDEDLMEKNFSSINAISNFIKNKLNHSECAE
jgi:acyl carrier protein